MAYRKYTILLEISCQDHSDARKIELMMNRLAHRAFPDKPAPFSKVRMAENVMFEQANTDEMIDRALETLSAYIDGHSTDKELVALINEFTESQEARQARG